MNLVSVVYSSMGMILLSIMVLLSVAIFTLLERKILGLSHFRLGPVKVGFKGLLQPFADALKLISKSDSFLLWSNHVTFYMSPIVSLLLSLVGWTVFPFQEMIMNFEFSILMILVILGLNIYGLLFSSWASNSKYSTIGGMRAISQALSYEVLLSFCILLVMKAMGGFSLNNNFYYKTSFFLMNPLMSVILMMSLIVELNRTPFDLAEGESELVSGFCVEYGGMQYTLIFLSENVFVVFSSLILSLVFLNNCSMMSLSLVWSVMCSMMVVIRSALPRIRYDKLVSLGWLYCLPVVIVMFLASLLGEECI